MKPEQPVETETLEWKGVTLSVSVERSRFGVEGLTHLSIQVVQPDGARIPITETGFRSHFMNESDLMEHGGALAYVRAWLDEAAESPEWKAEEAARRQLSLF